MAKRMTRDKRSMFKRLSIKHEKFCAEYVRNGCNAKAAAIAAGYSPKADSWPNVLMQSPLILQRIEQIQKRVAKKFEVTVERLIQEFAYSAFLDPIEYYDDEGKLLDISKMPEGARRALTGMEITTLEDGTPIRTAKIKYESKHKHLESLAKHLDMFKEHNTQRLQLEDMTDAELFELNDKLTAEVAAAKKEFEKIERMSLRDKIQAAYEETTPEQVH